MTTKATTYQPVERNQHSTVRVGDYLYMWGGYQPGLPGVHNNEKKKSMASVIEVCHLPSGRWEQKTTTGTPPLGVRGYASAVVGSEIYFFGGYCGHDDCFQNSLYSFNVNTLNWKEVSPTSSSINGPMMKYGCGMVAVHFDDENYLVIIGGSNDNSKGQQPGTQYGAQYESRLFNQYCNEIHYYKLSSGEWITPTVVGDRPPPIDEFTLTSITNNTAVLFGGTTTNYHNNKVYFINFTKTSVSISELPYPGGSVQWPKGRYAHSSVLINNSTGQHLLVVGGEYAYDCWLFDINKRIWKQLFNIPDTVTGRRWHSLSVWSVTPTTNWIIVFGGMRGGEGSVSDTRVHELRYTSNNDWSTSVIPLDQYQEKLKERRVEWEESQTVQKEIKHKLKEKEKLKELQLKQLDEKKHCHEKEKIVQLQVLDKYETEIHQQRKELVEKEKIIATLTQQLNEATAFFQQTLEDKEEQNEQLQELKLRKEAIAEELHKANTQHQLLEKTIESLTNQVEKLQEQLKDERQLSSSLIKRSATNITYKDIKNVGIQFDYLIPQSDLINSGITVAGKELFHLQGDRSCSFTWENYGFRLHCPKGAVSKSTEVAVFALLNGNFKVPKGTVLVSAVYAISVSKPLLKSLVIEMQHCVDLRNTGQTGCLKFVRGPLMSPYQLSPVEGGSFSVGKRYGSIKRDQFCAMGIVAGMGNGSTPSDSEGSTTQGSDNKDESSNESHKHTSNGGLKEGGINDEDTLQYTIPTQGSGNEHEYTSNSQETQVIEVATVGGDKEFDTSSDQSSFNDAIGHPFPPQNEVGVQVDRIISESKVTHNDILYTGMMYHEEKKFNHWLTTFSAVRDLEVLKRFLENSHYTAEQDGPIVIFKYIQPDGNLQLCIEVPLPESGWIVHPDQQPMELLQCVVDRFQDNPMCSSLHMSVYAKPGIAQEPLHCPIRLTGIDPSKTIYINRSPPPPPSLINSTTYSTSFATGDSQGTEKYIFRSDVAYRVMTECSSDIKSCMVDLHFLSEKLLEKKIINLRQKKKVTDENTGHSYDQRMDELLEIIKVSIKAQGKVFGYILEILKGEDTIVTNTLYDDMMNRYMRYQK